MIHSQATKSVSVIIPQSVGTTEVTGTFSTQGYDYASIYFHLDTAAASSVITSARVSEADGTSYTAITSGVGGTAVSTSVGYVLPVPNTSTPDVIVHHIDLRGRKKNLKVGLGSTTARLASVMAVLSRAEQAPDSDTEAGATRVIY
jgi:hypothetical protein